MAVWTWDARDAMAKALAWRRVVLAALLVLCCGAGARGAAPAEGYFIIQTPWQPVILRAGTEATPFSSATIIHLGPEGRFQLLEVFLVQDSNGEARFEEGQAPWVSLGTLKLQGHDASVTLHNVTVDGDFSVADELTARTERLAWSPQGPVFAEEQFVELCDPGLRAEADAWFTLAEHLDRLAGR
jgi:hypothetical protein